MYAVYFNASKVVYGLQQNKCQIIFEDLSQFLLQFYVNRTINYVT